ncbi:hypothetical protein K402DRAFT_454793 [Aulographum hederae CBS 113979]|uniref:Uncharacterized protein n=1 Tax=Aulographum hederae CBS 113979 TaxID=1176131 RepID=A0A6G1GYC6_9PEZI|nr:hypothetical protein K402DRAFT_454793 [Aulographum hederae CBS 113979]
MAENISNIHEKRFTQAYDLFGTDSHDKCIHGMQELLKEPYLSLSLAIRASLTLVDAINDWDDAETHRLEAERFFQIACDLNSITSTDQEEYNALMCRMLKKQKLVQTFRQPVPVVYPSIELDEEGEVEYEASEVEYDGEEEDMDGSEKEAMDEGEEDDEEESDEDDDSEDEEDDSEDSDEEMADADSDDETSTGTGALGFGSVEEEKVLGMLISVEEAIRIHDDKIDDEGASRTFIRLRKAMDACRGVEDDQGDLSSDESE